MAPGFRSIAGLGLLCLVGCATISGSIPDPAPPFPSGRFLAGAARVDITPHPGYPMGGHSIAGKVARGYWTRLYCRTIYLEAVDGRGLALVSCDLWSMPAGLGDRVAEILSSSEETRHLGRERILVAATHTHQSPGNFSSSISYNQMASLHGGFDRKLFEFLANRIANAVVLAARAKVPARLFLGQTRVKGLARNRSLEPFLMNPEGGEIISSNQDLPLGSTSAVAPDPRAYRAVDPTLSVLRAEREGDPGEILAMACFVAVHPTAMSHATEVYSGDLFSVATTLSEQALSGPSERKAVVALFNGAEGDVSPAWDRQDRQNTMRLGRILAAAISTLRSGGARVEGPIEARFATMKMGRRNFIDRCGVKRRTPSAAVPGVAVLGGAEDGRTLLYDLGWVEGVKGKRSRRQGSKMPAFEPRFLPIELPFSITGAVASIMKGPEEVPLGVYRLGPVLIASLPGEFSTVLGRRIREALSESMTPRPKQVLLAGLANEYLSYFTTPEEYEEQHYEGASTLYGPASGDLMTHDLVGLAESLALAPPAIEGRDFSYSVGSCEEFGLKDAGGPPYLPDDGLANVLQDLATGRPRRDFPSFTWNDGMPNLVPPHDPSTPVTPRVAIEKDPPGGEELKIQGIPEDDRGLRFVTVASARGSRSSLWTVFWMPPKNLAGSFRFRVDRLDGTRVFSPAFSLGE